MNILDYWKPHKLEERGIQQVSEAQDLLETYGANLSPSNRDKAESLLALCVYPLTYWNCTLIRYLYSAEDLGLLLKRKHPLARLRLAKQYDRKAGEVLRLIEVSCMIILKIPVRARSDIIRLARACWILSSNLERASTDQRDS